MSLSKKQKDFLKTIKNKKERKNQKQQFKLQNKFDKFELVEEIIFIDGIFKTDNPNLIAFFNECPMVGKSEENSLTKESLRDITEPKTEIDRTKTHSLLELSFLTDLSIKEVNKCLIMAMQLDTKPWDMSASILMSKFLLIKKSLEDKETKEILSKTDNQNIPKEFCVEITEENKEVLEKLYETKNKAYIKFYIGRYLLTDSLFTYLDYKSSASNGFRLFLTVSTEEFLRYIGKEELGAKIEWKKSPNIYDSEKASQCLADESGLFDFNPNKDNFKDHWKIVKATTHEPKRNFSLGEIADKVAELALEKIAKTPDIKPLYFDLPKKENLIQNIECLSINDIIDSGVLIRESPLCQNLRKYLVELVNKKTNPLNLK